MKRLLALFIIVVCLFPVATATVNDYNASLVLLMHMNQTAGSPTTFIESSTGKTVTTVGGSTTTTAVKVLGNASGFFDGAGDYLTLVDSTAWDTGTNWTISAWVNYTALPSSGSISPIVGQMDSDSDHWEVRLGNTAGTYRWTIRRYREGGSPIDKSITSNAVTPGTNIPHQIVFQKNTTGYTFYQDGVNVGSTLDSTAFGTISSKLEVAAYIGSAPSYYNGYIDELAFWNGVVVPIADLYPQPYEIGVNTTPSPTPPTAAFTCTPLSVTLGSPIACTDASTGSPTNWTWDFNNGGNTSTLQNPTYTYSHTGVFGVNLTVNNTAGSSSLNRTNYITVTNVTGFTEQDIYLTGQYLVTFLVKSSTTNLPIANVTAVDSVSGQSYPSTNGTAFLTLPAGLYYINFIADGYQSKQVTYVVDQDKTHTVTMVPGTTPTGGTQSIWYTPWQVRIRIVDFYGAPLPNTNVTANYVASTLPSTDPTWLVGAFGVSEAVAADMLNSSMAMSGDTDDNGGLAFTMFKSIQYRLAITNTTSGVASTKTLYPSDQEYVIYVRTAGQVAANNTLEGVVDSSLPFYKLNATHYNLSMIYHDTSGYTTNVVFNVRDWTGGNVVVYTKDLGNPGTSIVTDNYTVAVPLGQEYIWEYNATKV
jgi:PKD repeat protein